MAPASSRTKRTAVPRSKAKTAYGLLSKIAALIVDEPKRYHQGRFLDVKNADDNPRDYPSCGTVGCVAGWVVTLKGKQGNRTLYPLVGSTARKILGISDAQSYELFHADALDTADHQGPPPQTAAHARKGAAHIRKFQKAHRAQLLEKKL